MRRLIHVFLLILLISQTSVIYVSADRPQTLAQEGATFSPIVASALRLPEGVRYNVSYSKPAGIILNDFSARITLPLGAELIDVQETETAPFVSIRAGNRVQGQTMIWASPLETDESQTLVFSFWLKKAVPITINLAWAEGSASYSGDVPVIKATDTEGRVVLNSRDSGLILLPVAETGIGVGIAQAVVPDNTTITVRKLPIDFNPPSELGDLWWCSLLQVENLPEGAEIAVQVPLRKPLRPAEIVSLFAQQPDGSWQPLPQFGMVSSDGQFVAYMHPGGIVATGTDPALESAPPAEVIVEPPAEAAPPPAEEAPPAEAAPQPAEAAPQPVEAAPQPVEAAPQPVEVAPQPVEAAPQPVEAAPQPVEAAPQPAEAAPQPVEAAPQPVEAAPQPAEVANSEVVANPDGSTTTQSINAEGSLFEQKTENPDGSITIQALDGFGNVIQTTIQRTNPDGSVTNITQSLDGTEVVEDFDQNGNAQRTTTVIQNEDGTQVRQTVAEDGTLLEESTLNPDGSVTQVVFDPAGNVTQTRTSIDTKDGGRREIALNPEGTEMVESIFDPEGKLEETQLTQTIINRDGTITEQIITLDSEGNEINRVVHLLNADGTPASAADLLVDEVAPQNTRRNTAQLVDEFVPENTDSLPNTTIRGANQPIETIEDIIPAELLDKKEDAVPPETTLDVNNNIVTRDSFPNEIGGQTTIITTTDTTGSVLTEVVQIVDGNGNVTETAIISKNSDGSQVVERSFLNETGDKVEEISTTNPDGVHSTLRREEDDLLGQVTETNTTINPDGSQVVEVKILDDAGNQLGIRTTTINPDGSTTTIMDEIVDSGSRIQGRVTVAPDGSVVEELTTVVGELDTPTEIQTLTRTVNPDGSETLVSNTTDADGNVTRTENTTVNPDGSSRRELVEFLENGNNATTNSTANSDGSFVSSTVTRNTAGIVVGVAELNLAPDGTQTSSSNAISNTGVITNFVEQRNPDGSGQSVEVTRDFLGNVLSRTEEIANPDGTTFSSFTDQAGNVRQIFNGTEQVNLAPDGTVRSVRSEVLLKDPDGTGVRNFQEFIANNDGTITVITNGNSTVIDPKSAGEQTLITQGGSRVTLDPDLGIVFLPAGAEETPRTEPQVSNSIDADGNQIQSTVATDPQGNQVIEQIITTPDGEITEAVETVRNNQGRVSHVNTVEFGDGSVRFISETLDAFGNVTDGTTNTIFFGEVVRIANNQRDGNSNTILFEEEFNPDGTSRGFGQTINGDGEIIAETQTKTVVNPNGTRNRNTTITDGTTNTIMFEELATFPPRTNNFSQFTDGTSNTILFEEIVDQFSNGQNGIGEDLMDEIIDHQIDEIPQTITRTEQVGGAVIETIITNNPDGTSKREESIINEDGTRVQTTETTSIGEDGSKIIVVETVLADGRVINETTTENIDRSTTISRVENAIDGRIVEVNTTLNLDGTRDEIRNIRDASGNILETTVFRADGFGNNTAQTTFNAFGVNGELLGSFESLQTEKLDTLANFEGIFNNPDGTQTAIKLNTAGLVEITFPNGTKTVATLNENGVLGFINFDGNQILLDLDSGLQVIVEEAAENIENILADQGIVPPAPVDPQTPAGDVVTNPDGSTTTTTTATNNDGSTTTTATTVSPDGTSQAVSTTTSADGTITTTVTETFTPDGQSTGRTQETLQNNADGSVSTIVKVFDENGEQITGGFSTVIVSPDGTVTTTTQQQFFQNGVPVEQSTAIETVVTNADGSTTTTLLVFDQTGAAVVNQIITDVTNPDGSTTTTTQILDETGAELGQIIDTVVTNPDGSVTTIHQEQGDISKGGVAFLQTTTTTFPDGSSVSETQTTDTAGNILSTSTTNTDVEGTSITFTLTSVPREGSPPKETFSILVESDNPQFNGVQVEFGPQSSNVFVEVPGQAGTFGIVNPDGTVVFALNNGSLVLLTPEGIVTFPANIPQLVTNPDGTITSTVIVTDGNELLIRTTTTSSLDGLTSTTTTEFLQESFTEVKTAVSNPDGNLTITTEIFEGGQLAEIRVTNAITTPEGAVVTTTEIFDPNGTPLQTFIETVITNPDGSITTLSEGISADGSGESRTAIMTDANGLEILFNQKVTNGQLSNESIFINSPDPLLDGLSIAVITVREENGGISLQSKIILTLPDGSPIALTGTVDADGTVTFLLPNGATVVVGFNIFEITSPAPLPLPGELPESTAGQITPASTDEGEDPQEGTEPITGSQPSNQQPPNGVVTPSSEALPVLNEIADLVDDIDLSAVPEIITVPALSIPQETIQIDLGGIASQVPVDRVCRELNGITICTLRANVGQCLVSAQQFVGGQVRGSIACIPTNR